MFNTFGPHCIVKHTQSSTVKSCAALTVPPCMMSLRYWLLFAVFFFTRAFWPGGVWICSPAEVLARPNKVKKKERKSVTFDVVTVKLSESCCIE